MNYLDLESIDADAFHNTKPFPFINTRMLTDEGYELLLKEKPDVSQLKPSFGYKRNGDPHDRYVLEYTKTTLQYKKASPAWNAFVEELRGPEYTQFIKRMFGQDFSLNMHWHYTPRGASVSPHCDALHKLGSHIFYLNDDWDEKWGGGTVILDGLSPGFWKSKRVAPDFDDFEHEITSECMGNVSTLFARRGKSWHGVRKLTCPEGKLRKVFIVVINRK